MRFAAVILALASASIIYRADALAIGEIEVRTMLNEPLDARVPLIAVTPEELGSLVVSPASVAAYETAGLELTSYVADLDFEVVRGTPPFIRIRGQRPAREPFLDLLLEFSWGSGRLLRNYTILLDPPAVAFEPVAEADTAASDVSSPVPQRSPEPTTSSRATARSAQASTDQAPTTDPAFNEGVGWVDGANPETVRPAAPPPEPRIIAPAPRREDTRVGRYGPVQPKETLWSIAFRLRPDPTLTMSQMQLAIYLANPEAFDGNINTLRSGAMLHVPSAADVASLDALEAKQEIARQRQAYRPSASAPVPSSRPVPPPPPEPVERTVEAEPAPQPVQSEQPSDEPTSAQTDAAAEDSAPASQDEVPAGTAAAESTEVPVEAEAAVASAEPASTEDETPQRPMTALERLRAQQAGQPVPGRPEPPEPILGAQPDEDTSAEPTGETTEPVADSAAEDAVSQPVAPVQAPVEDEGGFPWLIVLLALVAGGGLGYVVWKRRQASVATTPTWPSAAKAEESPPSKSDEPPAEEALPAEGMATGEETATLAATASFDANDEAAELAEGLDPTPDDFGLEATTVFDAGAVETPPAGPASETPPSESTQQFHSETIMIDVSGDDPVAEADFHLAYGLYDEAALLLQQAMDADPGRADIKSKLAEVYFAASQSEEFVALARRVQPELVENAPAEWNRIAIMGQQIAADDPLFQAGPEADIEGGLDLDFDSDAEPAPAGEPAADFDLGDFDTPATDAAGADDAAARPADDEMSLEFDLEPQVGDESIDAPEPVESSQADDATDAADDGHSLEFTLDAVDSDSVSAEEPADAIAEEPATPAESSDEVEPADASAEALAFDIDTMTSDEPLLAEEEADAVLDELGDFEVADNPALDEAAQAHAADGPGAPAPADETLDEPANELAPTDGEAETRPEAAVDTLSDAEAGDLIGDTDLAALEADADDPAEFDFGEFGVPSSGAAEAGEAAAAESSAPEADIPASESEQDTQSIDEPAGDTGEAPAVPDTESFISELDDFLAEPEPSVDADSQAAPAAVDDFDVDLSGFDLDESAADQPLSDLESVADDATELDLGEFDFDMAETPDTGSNTGDETASADTDAVDLDGLFDADADADADEDGEGADRVDLGSKLDLARAYVDMGDAEMAGSLLDDVLAAGSDEQKAEATELKAQLAGKA
ncbi:MAG: FimV/HubP family polar landmark protein [Abyssibacter sp.]|uniref:FimV/HubP family polar landmark protein n=1 Tax=Abyssibacter sp. TaxID=2320200 RepID=UPI00321A5BF5